MRVVSITAFMMQDLVDILCMGNVRKADYESEISLA